MAIKVVNLHKVREKSQMDMLMREIKILQELKHENVIACRDVLMTSNNCYIVTDCYPEGDLGKVLAKKSIHCLKQTGLESTKDLDSSFK